MRTMLFATGLVTGAVIGGIIGMAMEPMKEKECKKMKKGAGSIIHTVGNIVDGFGSDC